MAGAWAAALGAVALGRLLRRLSELHPTPPRLPWYQRRWAVRLSASSARLARRLRRMPPQRSVTAELAHVEGTVIDALASASGVHRRLRPLVRQIAEDRVRLAHGLDVERDPDAVRAVVGEDVWELVRPDRPFPADAFGAGLSMAELDNVVRALEEIR